MTDFEAASREAAGEGPVIEVGGREVRFRPRLPIGIATATQRQDFVRMVEILCKGAEFVEPEEDDPPVQDFLEDNLYEDEFDNIAKAYGLGDMGNSPDSDG